MYDEIRNAHAELREALVSFNARWPEQVVSGVAWRLPLLREQKAPDMISVERLAGSQAIQAAQKALAMLEREAGQAPGTVMRLPGFFQVGDRLLGHVQEINRLKDALVATVEQTRLEMNLAKSARPRLLRAALGAGFSMMQVSRHIQAFDATPRLLVFTWAGHTAGAEKVLVKDVRELLAVRAEQQAGAACCEVRRTPAGLEMQSIANLADEQVLHRYKKLAPHPRLMLWFSEATRYDAMVHANLPVFIRAGGEPKVRELGDFDRAVRQAERPDRKPRVPVIPRLNLYLPTTAPATAVRTSRRLETVASTYRG